LETDSSYIDNSKLYQMLELFKVIALQITHTKTAQGNSSTHLVV